MGPGTLEAAGRPSPVSRLTFLPHLPRDSHFWEVQRYLRMGAGRRERKKRRMWNGRVISATSITLSIICSTTCYALPPSSFENCGNTLCKTGQISHWSNILGLVVEGSLWGTPRAGVARRTPTNNGHIHIPPSIPVNFGSQEATTRSGHHPVQLAGCHHPVELTKRRAEDIPLEHCST